MLCILAGKQALFPVVALSIVHLLTNFVKLPSLLWLPQYIFLQCRLLFLLSLKKKDVLREYQFHCMPWEMVTEGANFKNNIINIII